MARQDPILVSFNRGEVSTQLLGRTDLEHLRLASQIQENWQPRVLGPMTMRPGSEYLGQINQGNVPCSLIQFIASSNDRAIIELQPNQMRVWVVATDGSTVEQIVRAAVGTTLPPFGSSWTIVQQTGVSTISISSSGVQFANINTGANATVQATATVASGDVGVEHAIRLVVEDGPITFIVGSSSGADDLFGIETLDTGTYSMAFTPTVAGTIYVQIGSAIAPENYNTLNTSQPQGIFQTSVTSIAIEAAGPMIIATPWGAGVLTDQPNGVASQIRHDASADVTYIACAGVAQQQINRYSVTSWSIVLYKPVKGPMNAVPGSSAQLITAFATTQEGNSTMSANQPIFSKDDIGVLYRLFHNGQNQTQTLSFFGTVTDAIRITGISTISVVSGGTIVDEQVPDREFLFQTSGNWTGNIILQRSFSGYTTDFTNFMDFTSNTVQVIDDWQNNVIIWYRCLSNATGNVIVTFSAGLSGGGAGVVRVTDYISPTEVAVEILVPLISTGPAFDWHRSEWSPLQGYPTSVGIHEGRLWWAGADRWWGSSSDDYTNFDFDAIGDAAYIDIEVGQGPIANINWLLSLDGLLGGGDTQIIAARSDAIQTPLTPTNFNLRFSTSQGAAPVQAVKIDNVAIFINQSTRRIYQAIYNLYTYNYQASEISNLNPDIGAPGSAVDAHSGGYIGLAIQRNPDNQLHMIRSDGQIVCLLLDTDDDVKAFWRKTTQGAYDNVVVLPAPIEDMVIVSVIRNGVRNLERFARLDECTGDAICKLCDSFGTYTGPPTYTFSAPWLANQQVSVWIDGTDAALTLGEDGNPPAGFTYDAQGNGTLLLDRAGNGTLPTAAQNITFGLQYKAGYLSTKLAYAAQRGTAINEPKRVDHLGLVLQYTHNLGLRYSAYVINPVLGIGSFGPDFGSDFNTGPVNSLWDNLSPIDDMPRVEGGVELSNDLIWTFYDQRRFEFPANTNTDNRIWLEAASPRPATVIAATFEIETND